MLNAEADETRREYKRFSEHHYGRAQTLAAWLLATLVVVNGGAAVALLSVEDAIYRNIGAPLAAFAAGVALALASGMLSWQAAFDHAGANFLRSRLKLSEADKEDLSRWSERADKLERLSRWLNYASLAAFVLGCAAAGINLLR